MEDNKKNFSKHTGEIYQVATALLNAQIKEQYIGPRTGVFMKSKEIEKPLRIYQRQEDYSATVNSMKRATLARLREYVMNQVNVMMMDGRAYIMKTQTLESSFSKWGKEFLEIGFKAYLLLLHPEDAEIGEDVLELSLTGNPTDATRLFQRLNQNFKRLAYQPHNKNELMIFEATGAIINANNCAQGVFKRVH